MTSPSDHTAKQCWSDEIILPVLSHTPTRRNIQGYYESHIQTGTGV